MAGRSGLARCHRTYGQGGHARHQAVLRRTPGRHSRRRRLRPRALPGQAAHRELRRPRGTVRFRPLLHQQHVGQADSLQGPGDGPPTGELLPRSRRRPDKDGLRAGAFPFQHEHARLVEARPPLPLHHSQRRDQHHPWQRELDDGPRGNVLVPGDGRPDRRAVPDRVVRPE